jgi:heptosyltransferase-2
MLGLPPLAPKLYLSPHWHIAADEILEDWGRPCLGLNLSAGKRWPAKRLPLAEAVKLVVLLKATGVGMILLGGKDDFAYLEVIAKSTGCPILPEIPLGLFAAVVGRLQEIISSDSLALHLAIAQAVPSVSFYAPTSAAEINTFGFGIKVLSTAADYCSYKPDADNSSLTAERVFSAWNDLTGKKHHSIFS